MKNEFHGLRDTPEYRAWASMKSRCYGKTDHSYPEYGGRGITVGDEWRYSFLSFYRDMGKRPSAVHSLDRINNNEGYVPHNVRWATKTGQVLNRRNNRRFTYKNDTYTISEWAKITGTPVSSMRKLLIQRGPEALGDIYPIRKRP